MCKWPQDKGCSDRFGASRHQCPALSELAKTLREKKESATAAAAASESKVALSEPQDPEPPVATLKRRRTKKGEGEQVEKNENTAAVDPEQVEKPKEKPNQKTKKDKPEQEKTDQVKKKEKTNKTEKKEKTDKTEKDLSLKIKKQENVESDDGSKPTLKRGKSSQKKLSQTLLKLMVSILQRYRFHLAGRSMRV